MIGRIRTVKPEVFSDEKLWDLSQETGLPLLQAFEGLWCYSDREGRFEWRPRALKTLILPYWDGDFARALEALERGRYIVRYVVGGQEFGFVRNFAKHQRVNQREAQSTLPPPPDIALHVQAYAEPSPGPDPARGEQNRTEQNRREGDARADLPEIPGLERVGSGGSGGPARTHEMPGPDPTPSYLASCVMAGVRPEQARDTWVYYATKGLPPGDYPNLEGWLVLMAKQRQTSASKAPARASPGSDLDTTGAATAFKPNPDHERFARSALPKHDLALLAQKCRAVPRFARLSTAEQDREFAARLRHLKATGMFFADGPIPKARVQKEANP